MNENLPNIDDLFKKVLENVDEEPSRMVWENIDRKLDKKSFAKINVRYRRLKWIAAASIIMTAAFGLVAVYYRIHDGGHVQKNHVYDVAKSRTSNSHNTEQLKSDAELNKSLAIADADTTTAPSTIIKQQEDNRNVSSGKQMMKGESIVDNRTVNASRNVVLDVESANVSSFLRSKKDVVYNEANELVASKNIGIDENSSLTTNSIDTSTFALNQSANFITTEHLNVALLPGINKTQSTILFPSNALRTIAPILQVVNTSNSITHTFSKLNRWSATLFGSADFIAPNVKSDKPQFRDEERNIIKQRENPKTSSTMGILAAYYIGKRWSFVSGLTSVSRVSEIQSKTIFARRDSRGIVNYKFNCAAGFTYLSVKSAPNSSPRLGDSLRSISAQSRLQYLGVPLAIKYHLGFGKLSVNPLVGVTANFLLKGDIESSLSTATGIERTKSTAIQGLKPSYTNALLSLETSYKLNNRFALTVMPTSRFGLSPINKNTAVKTYFNSFSLAAGITVNL